MSGEERGVYMNNHRREGTLAEGRLRQCRVVNDSESPEDGPRPQGAKGHRGAGLTP